MDSVDEGVRAIDPLALASLTTGVVLCEEGFGPVSAAAEWVLGHPVWTHEFIDPEIQEAMIAAIVAQFPDMPVGDLTDAWRTVSAELRARYGATVNVRRGTRVRDRDPLSTLVDAAGDRKPIIASVQP